MTDTAKRKIKGGTNLVPCTTYLDHKNFETKKVEKINNNQDYFNSIQNYMR
jgi:hypothetical protein